MISGGLVLELQKRLAGLTGKMTSTVGDLVVGVMWNKYPILDVYNPTGLRSPLSEVKQQVNTKGTPLSAEVSSIYGQLDS